MMEEQYADMEFVKEYFCQVNQEHQTYWKSNERVWCFVGLGEYEDSMESEILSAWRQYGRWGEVYSE